MLPVWSLVLGWILAVVIVAGNGLVIYLITTRRNLRTTTNWFVLSLAVADFSVGTLYFPRVSFCSIDDLECVNHTVIVVYSIGVFFVYASVTNLCALTLDRYLAIVKPLRYVTFMTKKRVATLIFLAWSVAFLILISFLILLLATSGTTKNIMSKGLTVCITLLSIFACIFLLFATVRIFLIARKHSRQTAVMIAQLNYNHRLQRGRFANQDAAATKLVGSLVAVFALCYLMDMYDNFCWLGELCPVYEVLTPFNVLALLLNSSVNPVAYAFFKKEIRRELKQLFHYKQQQSPTSTSFNIEQGQRNYFQLTLRRKNRVTQHPNLWDSRTSC